MTTYTQAEFATHTLRTLGLVAAEETPSSADLSWAEEVTGSEIALLSAVGLPIWNGTELSVPIEYLSALARRCALAVAPSFGLTDVASAQLAMRDLERYLAVLAAPRGLSPLPLVTNDAMRYFNPGSFNFTTGQ